MKGQLLLLPSLALLCTVLTLHAQMPRELSYQVSVVPQPAQDHLRFELSLEEWGAIGISFYDMSERVVDRQPLVELDAGPQSIAYDSDQLATGSYLCVLTARRDDSLRVLSVPLSIIR